MPVQTLTRPQRPAVEGPIEEQTCLYIAQMCDELRILARRPRLRTLRYLLDMARLEAELTARNALR